MRSVRRSRHRASGRRENGELLAMIARRSMDSVQLVEEQQRLVDALAQQATQRRADRLRRQAEHKARGRAEREAQLARYELLQARLRQAAFETESARLDASADEAAVRGLAEPAPLTTTVDTARPLRALAGLLLAVVVVGVVARIRLQPAESPRPALATPAMAPSGAPSVTRSPPDVGMSTASATASSTTASARQPAIEAARQTALQPIVKKAQATTRAAKRRVNASAPSFIPRDDQPQIRPLQADLAP